MKEMSPFSKHTVSSSSILPNMFLLLSSSQPKDKGESEVRPAEAVLCSGYD